MTTTDRIRAACNRLADLLIAKNQAYGNSALEPLAIFGRGKASDMIRVRIDDKLSRIRNAPEAFGEDPILDLLGYLILLQLALEDEAAGGLLPVENSARTRNNPCAAAIPASDAAAGFRWSTRRSAAIAGFGTSVAGLAAIGPPTTNRLFLWNLPHRVLPVAQTHL